MRSQHLNGNKSETTHPYIDRERREKPLFSFNDILGEGKENHDEVSDHRG